MLTGDRKPIFAAANIGFLLIQITAESEGEQIAATFIKRILVTGRHTKEPNLSEQGLVGVYFAPTDSEAPRPALIILGGSGGDVDEAKAALLASRGYATLALDYFGNAPLPIGLSEIPLEYFETAIEWLKVQEGVDADKIGVIGTSRGGELALLLGATFPEIKSVVSYVGSGVGVGELHQHRSG